MRRVRARRSRRRRRARCSAACGDEPQDVFTPEGEHGREDQPPPGAGLHRRRRRRRRSSPSLLTVAIVAGHRAAARTTTTIRCSSRATSSSRSRWTIAPGRPPRRHRRLHRRHAASARRRRAPPTEHRRHGDHRLRPAVVVGLRVRPRPTTTTGPRSSPPTTSSSRPAVADHAQHRVPRRDPLVLDPGAERHARRRARAHAHASCSRPTSPACTSASARSTAACPTPTCSCGSSRCRCSEFADLGRPAAGGPADARRGRPRLRGPAAASSAGARAATRSTGSRTPTASRSSVEGNAALVAGHAPNLTHLMSRERLRRRRCSTCTTPTTGEFEPGAARGVAPQPAGREADVHRARGGRAARGMPDLGLTEDEIDQLVDYLVTLGPARRARPPDPTTARGRKLMAIAEIPQAARSPCRAATATAPRRRATPSASSPGPASRTGWRRGSPASTTRRSASCTAPRRCSSSSSAASRRCSSGSSSPARRQADLGRPLQPGLHHARRDDGLPRRSCRWARRS